MRVLISSIPNVRGLFVLNLILCLALAPLMEFTAAAVLAIVAMFFVYDCLGVIVANHRYWSHGSFEFKSKAVKYLFSTFALLSGTGSTLGWAGLHKLHHKNSDTPEDPHNQGRGFWRTMFLYYKTDHRSLLREALPLARDPFIRITDRYWLAIMAGYVAFLFLAFGLQGLYAAFIAPSALVMIAQGATNYLAHSSLGYRNHDTEDRSVNTPWLAPFNWGEAWHNNHHANPGKANLRERWHEIDISGFVIGLVKA